jgi:signal transduction histidine kinase/ActR/RegA family two-component response regulator
MRAVRFRQLRSRLIALGILTLVGFCAATAYDSYRSYRHTITMTNRELDNVANALAEQTAWTLQAVDLLLQDTARWYRNDVDQIPDNELDAVLASRTAAFRQVSLVTIVDAQGIQRHRSKGMSPPGLDVSDRSYFIALRDGAAPGLFMSEPLVTRSENRPGIILARALQTQNGQFAGVVTAIVNLEDLRSFYAAIKLGPGGHINLFRQDGTLLVSNPDRPALIGHRFPVTKLEGTGDVDTSSDLLDHQQVFAAAVAVRDTPLVLRATRETDIALRPWRDEALRIAARTGILLVLGAATLIALLRQLKRVEDGERALRQSQKMEAIGTLAGGIAHDFNNILGAIIGYGELAQAQAVPGSAQRRHLENVMHAAARAKLLVDRILGFSRSGLGERTLINVQFIVEETLELLEAALTTQVRLEKHLAAPDAGVIGDATELHQVIMNLCTNAQQAMPNGGVLTVSLIRMSIGESRTVTRGTLVPGRYLNLTIQDTGAGIPRAVYERIFDPFFTTKEVGDGTGLGLSLVHGIVADLGGAINVTTHTGVGTRFEIWLPDAGDAPRPHPAHPTEIPMGNGESVMIVDDETALVTLAEETLAELGYEPVGFSSSPQALAAFRADPDRFSAILTDEAMPEMTGTELVREIRSIRPQLPILLMSGHGGPALEAQAQDLGVVAVLHKPLQRRDLAEAIARTFKTLAPTER